MSINATSTSFFTASQMFPVDSCDPVAADDSVVTEDLASASVYSTSVSPVDKYFNLVVNIPMYLPGIDKASVVQVAGKIKECLSMLDKACPESFKLFVVFGLNCSSTEEFASSIADKAQEINGYFSRFKSVHIATCMVTGFSWGSAKAGKINYVAIRNMLFEDDATQSALSTAIADASKKRRSAVKIFFLDPDTYVTQENFEQLQKHWEQDESAFITAGFYKFTIPEDYSELERIGAKIGVIFDRLGKQAIASLPEHSVQLTCKQISLFSEVNKLSKKNDLEGLKTATKTALNLLRTLRSKDVNVIKSYQDLESNLLNEKSFQKSLQIVKGIKECQFSPASGNDILYPTEPALIAMMYDKQAEKIIDIFDAYKKHASKDFKFFGNYAETGGGEGPKFCAQYDKLLAHLVDNLKDSPRRPLIDFTWTYKTDMPNRIKYSKVTRAMLKNLEARGLVGDIIDVFEYSYCSQSQSFLGNAFYEQRRKAIDNFSHPKIIKTAIKENFLPSIKLLHRKYSYQARADLEKRLLEFFPKAKKRNFIEEIIKKLNGDKELDSDKKLDSDKELYYEKESDLDVESEFPKFHKIKKIEKSLFSLYEKIELEKCEDKDDFSNSSYYEKIELEKCENKVNFSKKTSEKKPDLDKKTKCIKSPRMKKKEQSKKVIQKKYEDSKVDSAREEIETPSSKYNISPKKAIIADVYTDEIPSLVMQYLFLNCRF